MNHFKAGFIGGLLLVAGSFAYAAGEGSHEAAWPYVGGGSGSAPSFSGAGNPTSGTNCPSIGSTYLNTTDGSLWRCTVPTPTNTWVNTGSTVSDATTGTKGVVQLSGDLTGSATSPQIGTGVITNTDINASAGIDPTKVANTPAGNIAATNVQAAINELDTEKGTAYDYQVNLNGMAGSAVCAAIQTVFNNVLEDTSYAYDRSVYNIKIFGKPSSYVGTSTFALAPGEEYRRCFGLYSSAGYTDASGGYGTYSPTPAGNSIYPIGDPLPSVGSNSPVDGNASLNYNGNPIVNLFFEEAIIEVREDDTSPNVPAALFVLGNGYGGGFTTPGTKNADTNAAYLVTPDLVGSSIYENWTIKGHLTVLSTAATSYAGSTSPWREGRPNDLPFHNLSASAGLQQQTNWSPTSVIGMFVTGMKYLYMAGLVVDFRSGHADKDDVALLRSYNIMVTWPSIKANYAQMIVSYLTSQSPMIGGSGRWGAYGIQLGGPLTQSEGMTSPYCTLGYIAPITAGWTGTWVPGNLISFPTGLGVVMGSSGNYVRYRLIGTAGAGTRWVSGSATSTGVSGVTFDGAGTEVAYCGHRGNSNGSNGEDIFIGLDSLEGNKYGNFLCYSCYKTSLQASFLETFGDAQGICHGGATGSTEGFGCTMDGTQADGGTGCEADTGAVCQIGQQGPGFMIGSGTCTSEQVGGLYTYRPCWRDADCLTGTCQTKFSTARTQYADTFDFTAAGAYHGFVADVRVEGGAQCLGQKLIAGGTCTDYTTPDRYKPCTVDADCGAAPPANSCTGKMHMSAAGIALGPNAKALSAALYGNNESGNAANSSKLKINKCVLPTDINTKPNPTSANCQTGVTGVTITRSGSTATVTHTAHGFSNGTQVKITGADQPEYNGTYTISNVATNTYDYTVSGTPATPATGTISSHNSAIDCRAFVASRYADVVVDLSDASFPSAPIFSYPAKHTETANGSCDNATACRSFKNAKYPGDKTVTLAPIDLTYADTSYGLTSGDCIGAGGFGSCSTGATVFVSRARTYVRTAWVTVSSPITSTGSLFGCEIELVKVDTGGNVTTMGTGNASSNGAVDLGDIAMESRGENDRIDADTILEMGESFAVRFGAPVSGKCVNGSSCACAPALTGSVTVDVQYTELWK